VEINAPPARVWSVLMEFAAYGAWNPFIRSIRGEAKVGAKLDVQIHPPKGRPMRFRPVVQRAERDSAFVWKGNLGIPGLFDGEHRFELESIGPGATKFRHGETFSGLLVPLIWGMMAENTRQGFETMNTAIKQRCESGS
jgi:hypothetical protein